MAKQGKVKRFKVREDGTFVASCGAVFKADASGLLGPAPWVQPFAEVHIKSVSCGRFGGGLAIDTAGGIWVSV